MSKLATLSFELEQLGIAFHGQKFSLKLLTTSDAASIMSSRPAVAMTIHCVKLPIFQDYRLFFGFFDEQGALCISIQI
jgi:hypothetical protein